MAAPSPPRAEAPGGQAVLAEGIHLAVVDEDVIVLDVRTDAYASLAGAATILQLDGGRVTATADVIAQLRAAGLVANPDAAAEAANRRPLPALPVRAIALPDRSRGRLMDTVRFWRAWHRARRLKRVSLGDILAEPRQARCARAVSEAELGQLTSTFVRLLPWAPGQGACLYRAYLLRTLLRQAGTDAQWIFGVRTWPFSAHCWLQVGDAVLDDDPDRVRTYTPIMAV